MPKFDPKKWKEKQEDKVLEEKYGENWKLVKRTIKAREELRRKRGTI